MPDKNPPVFFTVAAVKHEPLLLLEEFFPKIQDQLRRDGYAGPVRKEILKLQVGDAAEAEQKAYSVFTPDNSSAFTFNDQGIFSYHTTAYASKDALFTEFRRGLDVLKEIAAVSTVTRVGVRMLDLIRPSDTDHQLKDYLDTSLLGFSGLKEASSWTSGVSGIEHRFTDGNAEVIARLACFPDSFGLPADVFGSLNGHTLNASVTGKSGVLHCILDIDSGTRTAQDSSGGIFDRDAIMAELGTHKARISKLFRSAVSPFALKTWGLA